MNPSRWIITEWSHGIDPDLRLVGFYIMPLYLQERMIAWATKHDIWKTKNAVKSHTSTVFKILSLFSLYIEEKCSKRGYKKDGNEKKNRSIHDISICE